MYIIKDMKRANGIYIIWNIVKNKAYVGLAENLANRTLDHIIAICKRQALDKESVVVENNGVSMDKTSYLDNKNLLEESDKEFIHFAIKVSEEKLTREYLQKLESAFMVIVREKLSINAKIKDNRLYNEAKKSIQKDDIDGIDFKQCERELEQETKNIIGYTFSEVCMMEEQERKSLWNRLEFEKVMDCYKLNKGVYLEDSEYNKALKKMRSFAFSKSKLQAIGIDWDTVSVYDLLKEEKNVCVGKFGMHNGEMPYEIILKMKMDMEQTSDGIYYWAVRNEISGGFKERIRKTYPGLKLDTTDRWPSIYVLFKTTTSDNSAKCNVVDVISMEEIFSRERIEKKDLELKYKNNLDLKHSYYDSDLGKWRLLPKEHTYITISSGNEKGIEDACKALKIGKCYFIKEDIKELITKIDPNTLYPQDLPSKLPKFELAGDDVTVFAARLDYPYMVHISHISTLEKYLRGRENGNIVARVLLQMKFDVNIKKDTPVVRAVMFEGDDVYVCDTRNTYGDIKNDTTVELANDIKNCKDRKGTYEVLSTGIKQEKIVIHIENEEDIVITLSEEETPMIKYVGKNYKNDEFRGEYYMCCFSDIDAQGNPIKNVFHYKMFISSDASRTTPPFVFDL